jgi:hypothetical protein
MDTESLRLLQARFEPVRRGRKAEYLKSEELCRLFQRRFPPNSILGLTLESYAIGHRDKDNFCYWVELKTRELGDIRGATALKFRVYFDKTADQYVYQKQYDSADSALEDTLRLIEMLLASVRDGDWVAVDKNALSPMFKTKIISLYFPDKIAPIFADTHLDFFLRQLGLPWDGLSNIEKNLALARLKVSDSIMAGWSPYEFMDFLYESFGRPGEKGDGPIPSELHAYIDSDSDFPRLSDVKPEEALALLGVPQVSRSFGHAENGNALGQRLSVEEAGRRGLHGELVVLEYERERLLRLSRADLAEKVEHTAAKRPGAGYDVASFNEDGSERLIEVKATVSPVSGETVFMLTRNEYEVAASVHSRGGCYFLYRVFLVKSKAPQVLCIKYSDLLKNARFEPLVYEVSLTVTPTR